MKFSSKVAKELKTVDCERIGMAVVGLEVPHVHIHLIPINSMNDMNFSNSLDLKKQDFEDLSNKIKKQYINMNISGKVKLINETKEYGSNGFRKREIVLTTQNNILKIF